MIMYDELNKDIDTSCFNYLPFYNDNYHAK